MFMLLVPFNNSCFPSLVSFPFKFVVLVASIVSGGKFWSSSVLFILQEHLKQSDLSFVFRLQVSYWMLCLTAFILLHLYH